MPLNVSFKTLNNFRKKKVFCLRPKILNPSGTPGGYHWDMSDRYTWFNQRICNFCPWSIYIFAILNKITQINDFVLVLLILASQRIEDVIGEFMHRSLWPFEMRSLSLTDFQIGIPTCPLSGKVFFLDCVTKRIQPTYFQVWLDGSTGCSLNIVFFSKI